MAGLKRQVMEQSVVVSSVLNCNGNCTALILNSNSLTLLGHILGYGMTCKSNKCKNLRDSSRRRARESIQSKFMQDNNA